MWLEIVSVMTMCVCVCVCVCVCMCVRARAYECECACVWRKALQSGIQNLIVTTSGFESLWGGFG